MLTTKQKSYLKSLAHPLKPVFQIGKDGINENMMTDILAHLRKNELMKISILNNSDTSFEEAINAFNEENIEVVQKIGHTLILYKYSTKAVDPIRFPKVEKK